MSYGYYITQEDEEQGQQFQYQSVSNAGYAETIHTQSSAHPSAHSAHSHAQERASSPTSWFNDTISPITPIRNEFLHGRDQYNPAPLGDDNIRVDNRFSVRYEDANHSSDPTGPHEHGNNVSDQSHGLYHAAYNGQSGASASAPEEPHWTYNEAVRRLRDEIIGEQLHPSGRYSDYINLNPYLVSLNGLAAVDVGSHATEKQWEAYNDFKRDLDAHLARHPVPLQTSSSFFDRFRHRRSSQKGTRRKQKSGRAEENLGQAAELLAPVISSRTAARYQI